VESLADHAYEQVAVVVVSIKTGSPIPAVSAKYRLSIVPTSGVTPIYLIPQIQLFALKITPLVESALLFYSLKMST